MTPLLDKRDFIGLDRYTWLYNGAESPPHKGVRKALDDYVTARGTGPGGRERNAQIEQSCKRNLAALLNGKEEQVALISNVSEAISNIALSLGLGQGDNVVINSLEFPSGVLPWLALREKGVEVRVVPHQNWEVTPEDILARVDPSTRLVLTSHVSYLSGARIDYKALYSQLKDTDALLLLDATQSLGAMPVDINCTDFVVSSSYKWLLGTHGVGILGVNPQRTASFTPQLIGWRSVTDIFGLQRFESFERHADARRFELGYGNYPTIYALNFTTNLLLGIGKEKIEQHILALGKNLIAKLQALDFSIMTPVPPARHGGNISFVCPEGERLANTLYEQGILVWGGDGRVRASLHLYNDEADVDKLIEALTEHKNTIHE